VQARFTDLPGWDEARLLPGLRAFAAGCDALAGGALARACEAARPIAASGDEASARRFVEASFAPWALGAAGGAREGLITGYYEPVLEGARERSARFRYPVYGVPSDLVDVELESVAPELRGMRLRGRLEGSRVVPYWSRSQIEDRPPPAPVLAWVDDPVALFFLQIQGSGQIRLASGDRLRLAYADQNGHPYRALGRVLVERGELTLEQATMQGIRAWAEANPGKVRDTLDANPSYVFFRELPPGASPVGSLGVPLAAGYSLAVDTRAVPLGAPVYLATTWPGSTQPLLRLAAAQDTGGAIRGAVRADVFWGTGEEAGALAGRMRERGQIWVLWPRDEPLAPPQ